MKSATPTSFNPGVRVRMLDYLAGERLNAHLASFARSVVIPGLAFVVFLMLWSVGAKHVETSLGQLPGPAKVWEQAVSLYQEHQDERARESAFNERMQKRLNTAIAAGKSPEELARIEDRRYTGVPTFLDQILTSLMTVATGFLLASLVAIPIGIVCGMSPTMYQALNPLIQVFKPVSPLAWLPLVTMVVVSSTRR